MEIPFLLEEEDLVVVTRLSELEVAIDVVAAIVAVVVLLLVVVVAVILVIIVELPVDAKVLFLGFYT